MAMWKNSQMHVYFSDGLEQFPCEVRIDDEQIAVSYRDDGFVVYNGKQYELGHFKLSSDAVKGRGTLHMNADFDVLEGSWWEEGATGMWRIELN